MGPDAVPIARHLPTADDNASAVFQVVSILKGVLEIVIFTMLGRALLFILAGRHRETNVVYKAFGFVTERLNAVVRAITPRFIVDAHVPFITFFLLLVLWVVLLVTKIVLWKQLTAPG